jgi:hypothetical protein
MILAVVPALNFRRACGGTGWTGGISEVSKVRVHGPLAQFAPLVAEEARQVGYTPLTTAGVLRLTASLSRWMEARGLVRRT